MSSSCTGLTQQGTQKFGGVRVGNGPTEDEAGIMDHDQLSQHSEEGDEVSLDTHYNVLPRCAIANSSKHFPELWEMPKLPDDFRTIT